MGIIKNMRASVAALEVTLQETKARTQTRAELVAAELEQLRAWRIESAKRYVRRAPSSPPKAASK
jgi:hypothetical protein